VASLALQPAVVVGFALSGGLARHLDKGRTRLGILSLSSLAAALVVLRALW